jgi:L-alanine-DL-glutamate epimerase-like enolase superfamily enzyme
MASAEVWSLTTHLVKLVSDDGTVGWGETCPVGPTYAEAHAGGALAALALLAPGLIRTAPWPVPLHRRMDEILHGHSYAKAAIDIAAHDLIGRALGVSVSDLLGGALTGRVASYYSVGLTSPEETARISDDKRREGYPRLQLKLGGRDVEEDIAALRKTWELVRGTGTRLAADGNRGWTTRDALRVSRECPEIPFVMEQPVTSVEDMQKIRPLCRHALFMDESATSLNTVITAAGSGLVDGFGMKLTRIGGLHPMRAFRDICAARNLPHTCDDSWGGDIISAACTHIAATVAPSRMEGAWLAAPYIEGHYDVEHGPRIEGGHIRVPQGPGLGVVPDEAIFGAPVLSCDTQAAP